MIVASGKGVRALFPGKRALTPFLSLGWNKGDADDFGVPGESYTFTKAVKFWETMAPLRERAYAQRRPKPIVRGRER